MTGAVRRAGVPVILATAISFFVAGSGAGATVGATVPFCQDALVRDFARPFERMPPEHPPPEGELSFGPRNLSIFRVDWTRVVLKGRNLGYRFGAKDAGPRVLHLNWDVVAGLIRIDRSDREIREVRRIGRRFSTLTGYDTSGLNLPEFVFPAKKRGLYRLDLSFRNLRGKRLGAYREYFRVVAGTVKANLAVSGAVFQPGETVYARAEDLGTKAMFVPTGYSVERHDGAAWVKVGNSTTPGTALSSGDWWISGGEGAPCTEYPISLGAVPGQYRISTAVRPLGTQRERGLVAVFRVEP